MATNFNADELSTTVNIIKGFYSSNNDVRGISEMISIISEKVNCISTKVASEDSNLSETCVNLYTTLDTIATKINEISNNIIDELTIYASQTLENERGTNKSLDDINSELDSINSTLDSLDEKSGTNQGPPFSSDSVEIIGTTSRGNLVG